MTCEGREMKQYKYKIAGGNTTLLVEGCISEQKAQVVKKDLQSVEQVGFISKDDKLPTLEMMGDELCINGTLAFASMLGGSGSLLTSSLTEPVKFNNIGDVPNVTFRLDVEEKPDGIVLLPGIGFKCVTNEAVPSLSKLAFLAKEFDKPAFGVAFYSGNQLYSPYIYVQGTNTLIRETACGSASIALNVITAQRNIYQPTGQKISVLRFGNRFTVSAKVVKMRWRNE